MIGVLTAAKSKVIKRWQQVDLSITDAINETKVKQVLGEYTSNQQ